MKPIKQLVKNTLGPFFFFSFFALSNKSFVSTHSAGTGLKYLFTAVIFKGNLRGGVC